MDLEVSFLNTSEGATHYDWDFGDGTLSTTNQATHTFLNAPDKTPHTPWPWSRTLCMAAMTPQRS